jgi:hypothetical protein
VYSKRYSRSFARGRKTRQQEVNIYTIFLPTQNNVDFANTHFYYYYHYEKHKSPTIHIYIVDIHQNRMHARIIHSPGS